MTIADFDNDGAPDLFTSSRPFGDNNGINRLYLNNGTPGAFANVNRLSVGANDVTLSVAIGDVDGDGDLDLVEGVSGINKMYLNNGSDDPFLDDIPVNIGIDADGTESIAWAISMVMGTLTSSPVMPTRASPINCT